MLGWILLLLVASAEAARPATDQRSGIVVDEEEDFISPSALAR